MSTLRIVLEYDSTGSGYGTSWSHVCCLIFLTYVIAHIRVAAENESDQIYQNRTTKKGIVFVRICDIELCLQNKRDGQTSHFIARVPYNKRKIIMV